MTTEQVQAEIERLKNSPYVKLAKKRREQCAEAKNVLTALLRKERQSNRRRARLKNRRRR